MFRRARRLALFSSVFVLFIASTAGAQIILDMQMYAGAARSQGTGNPGPIDAETIAATKMNLDEAHGLLVDAKGHLEALAPFGAILDSSQSDPRLHSEVVEAIELLERFSGLVDHVRNDGPALVWNDDLPRQYKMLRRLLSPEDEPVYSLQFRITNFINLADLAWHGKARGVSVDEKDPDGLQIIPLRTIGRKLGDFLDELARRLSGLDHLVFGDVVRPVFVTEKTGQLVAFG